MVLSVDEEEEKQKQLDVESLSFAKQLFLGRLDQSKLIPYPRPSLEEKEQIDLLCHKLRQFSETHIDPVFIDRNAKIPEEVIQGLGKLGVLGLLVPQQYGGLGMTLTGFCRVLEVISQRCGSTAAFLTAHQGIGFKALLLFGSPEQKQKWLPGIAKGEIVAAFALTEPNAGSDIMGVETKAVYDYERNVFYLTGKKQWITNGSFAKVLTVIAKTEIDTIRGIDHGLTAFIVTPDMPGFKVTESSREKVGMRGVQSTSLEFDHMEVPAENLLGKLGQGRKIALSVLNYGRITVGASCAGPAKILVDDAFKHARDRHQFNQPLASFPLVKDKLAKLAALTYAMEAVTYMTAGKVDAGEKDFMLEAAMVKVFSSEALWQMTFETMQIFGGRAMFTDLPYELLMRDCRPSMIFEGSNDVMRLFISLTGIKAVSSNFNEFLQAIKNPLSSRGKITEGLIHLYGLFYTRSLDIYSPLLRQEDRMLTREVRRLGRGVLKCLQRYGERLVDKQIILERLAKAAIQIYTAAAVLSKIDSDLERANGKVDLLGRDLETAQFYCHWALLNAQQQLNSLFDQRDDMAEQLSDHLIEDL
jgi:acyl-CoA dehydrogenase family member 9